MDYLSALAWEIVKAYWFVPVGILAAGIVAWVVWQFVRIYRNGDYE